MTEVVQKYCSANENDLYTVVFDNILLSEM